MRLKEFSEFYHRRYMPLCMYALRLLGDDEEARDVVQESFATVWEKLRDGADIADLKSYMYRAVYNRAISLLRSRSDKTNVSLDLLSEEPSEEVIDTSERDAALWEAIDSLPERCREVFLLSKRDGLSREQIAERLDISIKTVETQMTKAFSRLRSRLRPARGSDLLNVFFLPFL